MTQITDPEPPDRPGSLGYVVVPCPRCRQPRRVEVLGEIGTIERAGTWALRMTIGDEEVGACYVKLRAGRADDHDCPKPPARATWRRTA